jgi:hypothetical protein
MPVVCAGFAVRTAFLPLFLIEWQISPELMEQMCICHHPLFYPFVGEEIPANK